MGPGVKSFSRRACTGMLAALLSVAGVLASAAPPAAATATFSFTRIAGSDRFATAAQSASAAFPSGATTALVANGLTAHFPDALAASYAAGFENAPILLTLAGSVPSATSAALQTLKVKNVIIVGGTAAVGTAVEDALKSDGYAVSRVAGQSRYSTAAALAGVPPTSHVGAATPGAPTAVVASGRNFPDALVSGPLGYGAAFPIEITDPSSLSPETRQSLQSLGIKHVVITGGPAAVSAAVESQIKALGITTERLQGSDRTETAALVAAFEVGSLGFSKTTIDLARGDDPADSLAGSPFGGVNKTPLLLTLSPSVLGSSSRNYIGKHSGELASGKIFGGTGAVSASVQTEATAAGRGANSTTVTVSPATVKANGATTSTVTVKVTNADGTAIANDGVAFSTSGSPAGACGTLSASTATTGANGQAATTYTSSKTPGTCTVTATESNGGTHGTATISQTASNTVAVSATPPAIPANGISTSSIKVAVKDGAGAPVANDTVTFAKSGNPAAACGSLPATATTDAGGNATVTYTSSTTVGFCTITATEGATGASGSASVTQTDPTQPASPNVVSATASPATVTANGSDTSTISVTVTTSNGTPVAGDTVQFSTGTALTACGTLSSSSATTSASGTANVTYTASTTAGSCTITATEAATAASDDVVVTQTAPNTVDVAANPQQVQADGTSTSQITATVTDGAAPVPGDGVTFASSGSPAGACGTLSPGSKSTGADGKATVTYTASTTAGFCTITATEAATGASSTVMITQTVKPPSGLPNQVSVVANPTTVAANGTDTSSITVTVTAPGGGAVSGDSVTLTPSGSPALACGTLTPTSGTTDSNGKMTSTYKASSVSGSCTITATEASGGGSGSATVTQGATSMTVAATPSSIKANGHDTSAIKATVKDGAGNAVTGKTVTFSVGAASTPGSCGTLSATSASTNDAGIASVTYTASTTRGSCTATAASSGTTPATANATITQTGPVFVSSTETAGAKTITLTYNEPILCASVDSNASDYTIVVDGQNQSTNPTISYSAACKNGGATDTVVVLTITLPLTGQFVSGQVVEVTATAGDDLNTVVSAAAMAQAAGDKTTHTVT